MSSTIRSTSSASPSPSRINELSELLKTSGKVLFEQLFEGARGRADLIVTFLAILEMTRLRLTRVEQEGPLMPIFIELAVNEEGESSSLDDLDRAYERSAQDAELAEAAGRPAPADDSIEGDHDLDDEGDESDDDDDDDRRRRRRRR